MTVQRSAARARCVAAIVFVLFARPLLAAAADTAGCRPALDDANRLMRAVQERQMQFSRLDPAGNCRLLRDNLDDLIAARDPLDRCLTGDEHTRSLSQIDAAIEQIRVQLVGNCRR